MNKEKERVLAGSIVSCIAPFSFIGDFVVGGWKSNTIGVVYLLLLILIFIMPLAVASTIDTNGESKMAVATLGVMIVCAFGLFACFVAGLVVNWKKYGSL